MTQNTSNEKSQPLSVLQNHLQDHMETVNALILERLKGDVPLIEKIAAYLIASGGKRIRPLLTLACGQICQSHDEHVQKLAAAVEFIHSATLLHDDVVDGSDQRRGQASANGVFDNKAPILVGDFLFSRAFQLMVESKSMSALKVLADASATIAEGEVLQLSMVNNLEMTKEQYFKIIKGKTAALFAAACEVAPILSDLDEPKIKAFHDFGLNLGMAFQIADDVLDYTQRSETLGKNIGDDFREGKITLPILICLENADEAERAFWQRTMGDVNQTDEDLNTALRYISAHNAIELGYGVAHSYKAQALKALDQFPSHVFKETLVDLCDFVILRQK